MMRIKEFPFLSVEVDEKASVISLHWSSEFTSEQYRQGCTWGLERVTALQLRYWLADTSKFARLQPADQKWTSEFLFPELSKVGLVKMAVVIPEDLYSHLAISTIIVEAKDATTFDTHYFVKQEEALAWMQS
ncbi:hypothetical protein [Rufibacter tibetensis]|uniref:STAS/SEC14 domain-containing protein n=1 Tax=Rufibacter tibetensis TaxID=512763 RepID=A0A0P0CWI9_9BACT|nr:hypothetical protein [Rufibacter tibetensis]ALI98742.1 hypothetical protein DC20_06900 [Rufibacter tibetensis]